MTDNKELTEIKKILQEEMLQFTAGYMSFYKQGFLDGYMDRNGKRGFLGKEHKVWKRIKWACFKKFEERFKKKIFVENLDENEIRAEHKKKAKELIQDNDRD